MSTTSEPNTNARPEQPNQARWLNWIGGCRQAAHQQRTMTLINPATGEALTEVPRSSRPDADAAVAAAASAFEQWRRTTPRERADLLLDLADITKDRAEDLAAAETSCTGKPITLARAEIATAADHLRFFAGAARTVTGPVAGQYVAGMTSSMRRDPLGVVAGIVPWNFPLVMAIWKLGPAVATGNAIVIKPADASPLSLLLLLEAAQQLLPPGLVNVVTGTGPEAGQALTEHPDVALIALTGSVATGKQVAATAARTLKRVSLELGGKAPVVVLDDADIEALAVRVGRAAFSNSGQSCAAPTRVIATPAVYDEVVERLAAAADAIKVGDPSDETVAMGPVVSAEHRDRIIGFVERAQAGGATLATQRPPLPDGPGFFVNPTVVTDVAQHDEIVQNEVFGPVATVQRAADADQAMAWANDVRYGLVSSLWTGDAQRAARLSPELRFGVVWVNTHGLTASELPHGGIKDSGYGVDRSIHALDEYTAIRHIGVMHA
jgi:1-pyrroline dehydrogenase